MRGHTPPLAAAYMAIYGHIWQRAGEVGVRPLSIQPSSFRTDQGRAKSKVLGRLAIDAGQFKNGPKNICQHHSVGVISLDLG